MHWFLKTSFSHDCSESSIGQHFAMLTISSWHKYLWLTTCAVQGWRGFSWSQIGFSNDFGGHRFHISPSTTDSCNKIAMKQKMSPADHQDRGEGWIRSGPTKFPCHRNACRGAAWQKTAFPSAWLRLCSTANHRESSQTANTQVQDLTATAATPREGKLAMGMIPMLGKSSRNAELHPALGQRLSPVFGVETPALWAARAQQRHTNPTTLNPLTANTPSSPYSQSASAHTMQGFFPPNSNVTLLRLLLEAASLISFPTCETQRGHELFPLKISSVIPTRVGEPGWQLKQVEVRENTLEMVWVSYCCDVLGQNQPQN